MATSDVSLAQDGGQGNVKLHPYLVTLVRWCVSCLWSTATVLLHRLMTTPLQPITGSKLQLSKAKLPKRVAGTEHLHPEPKVDCQLLHQPKTHTHDVIFVHGLYGSLGNTWRQGDWRPKYRKEPQRVTLRNRSTKKQCNCNTKAVNDNDITIYNITFNETTYKCREMDDSGFLTDNFYNPTLMDQVEILDNYEAQASFVRDLFKKECSDYESNTVLYNNDSYNSEEISNDCCETDRNDCENYYNEKTYDNDNLTDSYCVNDKNNSYHDNVKIRNENFYNENDVYNTIENNSDNLYNDNDFNSESYNVNNGDSEKYNGFNECVCGNDKKCEVGCGCNCDMCYSTCWPRDWIKQDYPGARVISINYTSDPYLWRPLWVKENKRLSLHERAEQMIAQLLDMGVGDKPIIWVGHSKGGLFIKQIYCEAYEAYKKLNNIQNDDIQINESQTTKHQNNNGKNNVLTDNKTLNNFNETNDVFDQKCNISMEYECKKRLLIENGNDMKSSPSEAYLKARSSLWQQSKGFMFYSVPHRGSPLADIKTPVTARSVELLEISKDCPLVLDLQSRWLSATSVSRPPVRSFVETCRTLMSVLWLRIVSVDSADAGIGTLLGVSVDHREICKPSSRKCLLYTELTDLMREALNECSC